VNSFEVRHTYGNVRNCVSYGVANMTRGILQFPAFPLLLAAVLLCTAGCGGGGVPATEEAARGALTAALDAWKGGRKAEEMRQQTPEFVVGDADWKQGRLLVGYQIGTGMFDGKNLRVPVTLTIAQPPRGNRQVIVNYIVGTNPVVTLFRDGE
jgi:hypothetical protein